MRASGSRGTRRGPVAVVREPVITDLGGRRRPAIAEICERIASNLGCVGSGAVRVGAVSLVSDVLADRLGRSYVSKKQHAAKENDLVHGFLDVEVVDGYWDGSVESFSTTRLPFS